MSKINRRSLLLALASVSLCGCESPPTKIDSDHPLLSGLDQQGIADIAKSYLDHMKNVNTKPKSKHLFVKGELKLTALENAAKADFNHNRIFKHKGWILSQTEGQLFTLLA